MLTVANCWPSILSGTMIQRQNLSRDYRVSRWPDILLPPNLEVAPKFPSNEILGRRVQDYSEASAERKINFPIRSSRCLIVVAIIGQLRDAVVTNHWPTHPIMAIAPLQIGRRG
jgi:hypothetical protein